MSASQAPSAKPAEPARGSRRPWLWPAAAIAVVALAAALRMYHLREWSYWSDEAFTISDANACFSPRPASGGPEHKLSFAVYGAFFAYARAAGWAFHEGTARALPALFGVLGVLATCTLGARAAGKPGALAGALLLAVSPFHLYWSQNARSYAMETALIIPAGLWLGDALMSGRVRSLVLGAAAAGLAAFAHPTALAVVPPLILFALVGRGAGGDGRRPPLMLLFAAAAALSAVVALSPLGLAIWKHFRLKSGASPFLYLSTAVFYFRPTLLAASVMCAVRGYLRRDRASVLLSCLGLGILGVGFAASFLVRANAQYAVGALPFLVLLVGRELAMLVWTPGSHLRLAAAALGLTLLADFGGGTFLYFGPEHGHRALWREACERVDRERAPEDLVASTQSPIVECYLNPANLYPREARTALYLGKFDVDKFESLTVAGRRVWFIILDVDLEEWPGGARDRFREFLSEQCRAIASYPLQFAGKDQTLRVWRYEPR